MAFQLRGDESPASGLRRLARKELRSARAALNKHHPPDDEAIHEARKSLKRVRAVMAIIDADVASGLDGAKRVRKVNQSLSRLRDADVMVETLTKLKDKSPRMLDEHTFVRLRRQLAAQTQASMEAASDAGVWKT